MKTHILLLNVALAVASMTQAEAAPRHALKNTISMKEIEVQREDRTFHAGPDSDLLNAPVFKFHGRSPGFVRDQPGNYPYSSANGS